jgi:hypothetical protein
MIAEGDKVVTRWSSHGTTKGHKETWPRPGSRYGRSESGLCVSRTVRLWRPGSSGIPPEHSAAARRDPPARAGETLISPPP